MASTFTAVRKPFGDFFGWWGEELTGMLPPVLVGPVGNAGPSAIICLHQDGMRLLDENVPDGGGDAGVSQRPTQTGTTIAAKLSSRSGARAPVAVGLRIPFSYCFGRVLELPAAAEKDFPRLLKLDMERATPFRSSDVYSAFTISPNATSRSGKTAVHQFIVKRSLLAAAIAELEAADLRVGRIDCWDESGRAPLKIDFRDADTRSLGPRRSLIRSIAAASLVATALAVSGGYGTLVTLSDRLSRLEVQAKELRASASDQRASQELTRSAHVTLSNLEALVTSPPSKLAVIDELTQILPDSAWISDLRATNDGVDINGFAQSTVALLPLLEKSQLFVDATSSAAVTFDPREDKERFSIHVRYRTAAVASAQAGSN